MKLCEYVRSGKDAGTSAYTYSVPTEIWRIVSMADDSFLSHNTSYYDEFTGAHFENILEYYKEIES